MMQMWIKWFGVATCALAVAACGGDGNGNGGSGGTAGTAGSGGTGGSTTSTVSGIVYVRADVDIPAEGVTVTVYGTQNSTTTNASGQFTLQNVPNGDTFFVTEKSGFWGVVDFWTVPDETAAGADFGVVPEADIEGLAGVLQRTISPADGAVDVTFFEGAAGGETASVSAPSDPPFTFNLADLPVEQPEIIADNDGFGESIFSSIDPGDGPVTVTVMGASGVTACEMDEEPGQTYPILPKAITIAYAFCQAAP